MFEFSLLRYANYNSVAVPVNPGHGSKPGPTEIVTTLACAKINAAVCGFVAHRKALASIKTVLARTASMRIIINRPGTNNRRDQVYSKASAEPQLVE